MQTGKSAVSAGASLAVSVTAVPAALSGLTAPAPPAGHDVAVPAALDVKVVHEVPPARPLVTRIVREAARKSYTVISGDTLSGIAGRFCGKAGSWPSLWHGNRAKVANPDMIFPGQTLRMTCHELALAAAQDPPAARPAASAGGSYGHPYFCGDGDGDGYDIPCSQLHHGQPDPPAPAAPHRAAAVVTGASGVVSTSGMGSMQACIIARESGGNSQVMNSTGHYGLYQFSASTWAAHGGNPADFGHASAAEQNQVFSATVAADGYSDWSPYDGC
jgi:hypothetical protein